MKINKIELEIEGKTVDVVRLSKSNGGRGAVILVNGAELTQVSPLADELGCFEKAQLVMNLCYGSSVRRGKNVPNYTNSMCHDMKDVLTQFIQ